MKTNHCKWIIICVFILSTLSIRAQICNQFAPVNLGNDTTLCQGDTLSLDLSSLQGYKSLIWEDNSTNPLRTVTTSGNYSVEVKYLGPNIIVNGNFSLGYTNFTTDYLLGTGGPWGLLSYEGTYAITTSPSYVHNNFSYCTDHTSGGGNMLVVNGASTPGVKVWCQNVSVTPNTDYEFSTWVTSALTDPNVAQLQFSINNTTIGSVFSPSSTGCTWSQFFQVWNSGIQTSANVCITNQNVAVGGNDFAIDDISFSPVCIKRDTIDVTFKTKPVFSLSTSYDRCEGDTLVLSAENSGFNYLWNNGDTTQTIKVTQSNIYSVVVSNDGYCDSTNSITVNFHAKPNAGANVTSVFCNTEQSIDLNSLLSAQAEANGIWEDNQQNNIANGVINIQNMNGNYTYLYLVDNPFCPVDTAKAFLTIHTFKSAGNDGSLHICNNVLTPLTNLVTTDKTAGYWLSIDGLQLPYFDITSGTFSVNGLPKGTYQFQYIMPNLSPCPTDTASFTISVSEIASVKFTADQLEGCSPLEVTFTDKTVVNADTITYKWWINGVDASDQNTFSHTFTTAQCNDITLQLTTDQLCISDTTYSNYICVNPNPIAEFTYSPLAIYTDNPEVHFINNSTNNSINQWEFSNLDTSNESEPTYIFPEGEAENYLVTLIVTSEKGCLDSVSQVVIVKDNTLFYIPNSFTPNGDEFNNTFQPVMTYGIDPTAYSFYIYNRWGEVVFESHDLETAWDGFYKGKLAQPGTYVWKIQYRDMSTHGIITKTGTLNLIQ